MRCGTGPCTVRPGDCGGSGPVAVFRWVDRRTDHGAHRGRLPVREGVPQRGRKPVFVGVCHCADCQRLTGSAFATVVAVPAPALKVRGALKTFTKPGDTGRPM